MSFFYRHGSEKTKKIEKSERETDKNTPEVENSQPATNESITWMEKFQRIGNRLANDGHRNHSMLLSLDRPKTEVDKPSSVWQRLSHHGTYTHE